MGKPASVLLLPPGSAPDAGGVLAGAGGELVGGALPEGSPLGQVSQASGGLGGHQGPSQRQGEGAGLPGSDHLACFLACAAGLLRACISQGATEHHPDDVDEACGRLACAQRRTEPP